MSKIPRNAKQIAGTDDWFGFSDGDELYVAWTHSGERVWVWDDDGEDAFHLVSADVNGLALDYIPIPVIKHLLEELGWVCGPRQGDGERT